MPDRVKRALSVVVVAASMTSTLAAAASPSAKPDVYLITIDTLRADHVHCYGYQGVKTPALDELAKNGIRFSAAFTPSPITNSSHTSILTGLLPSHHGVTDFAVPLAADRDTLAESMKEAGYQTAAFIGAVILDSKALAPGLDHGFDFYDNFPGQSKSKERWGRLERRGLDVVGRAEKWLTSHPSRARFVWVHLYDPHDPYEPPPPYSQTYKTNLYDGEVAYADSALGHFLSFLKAGGRYENSVIVVVGDHGEGLGEHHENTHGIFLYDSTTHVPLIVKLPGESQKERVVDAQVRTTDILPSVLDLVGVKAPPRLDGQSLMPLLNGSETDERVAFAETEYPLRFGWAPLRSVRAQGVKFIEAPRPELYLLQADPKEESNHYQPWDKKVQELRGMLADLKSEQPRRTSAASVGQGTIDELKALGYLGPADAGSSTDVPEPSLLPDPKDKIEQQNLLHSAMMASEDDRTDDARAALEKVLQLDTNSAIALRQLGELELRAANYAKAGEYLKRARAVDADDPSLAFHEGEALEKAGDLAGARDALEASLKLTPTQLDARLLLGTVYLGLEQPKAAADQFEAALLLRPNSAEAEMGGARSQMMQGEFAAAAERLLALSKSHPRDARVFDLLAEAYVGMGKREEAERMKNHARMLHGGQP